MAAYAIANLRDVEMGPVIVQYLRRIEATLEPYEGRFLVHGAAPEMLEGRWKGQPIIIQFPSWIRRAGGTCRHIGGYCRCGRSTRWVRRS